MRQTAFPGLSKARAERAFLIFTAELVCNDGRFGYFFNQHLCPDI
jgi:hypothetical protein